VAIGVISNLYLCSAEEAPRRHVLSTVRVIGMLVVSYKTILSVVKHNWIIPTKVIVT